MQRHGPSLDDDGALQAPMMGVMSVLMLLIPALILIGQVTRYSAIYVSTPRFSALAKEHDHVISCGGPRQLHVAIADGVFYTRLDGEDWTLIGNPMQGYDHDALAEVARDYKGKHPHETVAYVSAEHDVRYETLVATMDTLRGPDCRLAGALQGEEVPEECLLWHPIIQDRVPNHHLPEARRGNAWPPRPTRYVTDDAEDEASR